MSEAASPWAAKAAAAVGEQLVRSAYLNPNTGGNTTTTTQAHTA
jgi:hypothetical protein